MYVSSFHGVDGLNDIAVPIWTIGLHVACGDPARRRRWW